MTGRLSFGQIKLQSRRADARVVPGIPHMHTEALGHDQSPPRMCRRSLELHDGFVGSTMRHVHAAWQLCAEVDEEAESKLT